MGAVLGMIINMRQTPQNSSQKTKLIIRKRCSGIKRNQVMKTETTVRNVLGRLTKKLTLYEGEKLAVNDNHRKCSHQDRTIFKFLYNYTSPFSLVFNLSDELMLMFL